MKKIAVFHNLPSGGAKRSLYEWVKRLSKSFTIDLYIYSESSETYLDIRKFCRNVFLSENSFLSRPWNGIHHKVAGFFILANESYKIASKIDSENYSWVFVHHDTYVQSPLLLRFLSTPSLYYCQEPFRRLENGVGSLLKAQSWINLILRTLDRWAARKASVVACNSHYSRLKIREAYNIDPKVVHLGVDNKFFTPKSVECENYILSVGRVHPSKGHDFCIRVIGQLEAKQRPSLVVMGDSTSNADYAKYLYDLANSEGVVLSIITVEERELSNTYSRAKLVLCCQVFEPLGLSALEAICCHKYVIGVSEGGVLETIADDRVGKTLKRNIELFSNEVGKFLSDQEFVYDHKFSDRYIKAKWTWGVSTEKIIKISPVGGDK